MTGAALLHFVGFRGDEYARAVRIFGRPDMVHFNHDRRFLADLALDDTAIFANGCEASVNPHAVEPDF